MTPPGKTAHAMTYGVRGRIESYTPPVGNVVSFQYDLDRRMDLIDFGEDALGQPLTVDFAYDATTGQLSTVMSPTGTISVGYTNGHMTSLSSPSVNGPITTNIDYDGFLPTGVGWSGAAAGQVNWTYNDRFLIQTETIGALPSTTVSYQYDKDGLVTQAGLLSIQRDPTSGRVTSKTVGNIRERYEYNELGELSRQIVERMSGSTVVETIYDAIYDDNGTNGDRDALGRITKKTERIVEGDTPTSGARPLASRTYEYGYNVAGRPWLESVKVNGTQVSSYGYDENGNRTSSELEWSALGYSTAFDESLTPVDTEYDAADKLLEYGTKEYTWNAVGQLSSVHDTATNETTSYEYDLFGNLLSVSLPDGRTIEYDVDGAGRRVGRRVLSSTGVELEYRGWIYRDLLRPIGEVDSLGNVVARYVYADGEGAKQNGVSQLSTRLGANQNTSLPFVGENVPEFIEELSSGMVVRRLRLIKDQVGTVDLVADAATGEIVQRIEHDEFGRVLSDSNPGLQPFGFAGGLYDAETGLVRFGARDYDPANGRWTARDPVGILGGGLNSFVYCGAEPVGRLDPTGTFWEPYLRRIRKAAKRVAEAAEGAADFWRNYEDMRDANTIGADKYFHCKANCQATSRGPGGRRAAEEISEAREQFDENIKGDSRDACDADRAANQSGRDGAGSGNDCSDVCSSFRPNGLDPKY